MVELKTYVIQETREGKFIEVSDNEYEFLLSLLKVSNQQELLRSKYIFDGREGLQVTINNIYLPPVVRKGTLK
jgi:hypothetical protein